MVLPASINGESMWLEHEHIDERDLTFLVGLRKKYGYVPNFLVSFAGKRRLPETIDQLERIITFGGSRLGRFREELIAFYVSVINECHY